MNYKVKMRLCLKERFSDAKAYFQKTTSLPFVPFVGIHLSGYRVKRVNWNDHLFIVGLDTAEVACLASAVKKLPVGWVEV